MGKGWWENGNGQDEAEAQEEEEADLLFAQRGKADWRPTGEQVFVHHLGLCNQVRGEDGGRGEELIERVQP